jgi:hypothetical protein
MVPPLLATLEFRCNNTAYRPVMDALDLLARYAATEARVRFYAAGEQVPLTVSSRPRGGTPSWTRTAASSGSHTSCACWSRCGRRYAGGRWTGPDAAPR